LKFKTRQLTNIGSCDNYTNNILHRTK